MRLAMQGKLVVIKLTTYNDYLRHLHGDRLSYTISEMPEEAIYDSLNFGYRDHTLKLYDRSNLHVSTEDVKL